MIEETGYMRGAEYALSYKDSLPIFEKIVPDILFLDINLPDVNGIEMLKIFRKKYPFMKIIICSIHNDEFYINACKNLGADYFINKDSAFDLIPLIISEIAAEEKAVA